MMNREKKLLYVFVAFIALFLAYSVQVQAALPSCTKYQFINVKIAPEDKSNPRLEQFHGIDTGKHDSFDLTEKYDTTYICGIMLNEKLDWSGDSLAAVWAAKGAVIKKDGTSMKADLSEKGSGWQLCSDEDCDSKPACKIDVGLIAASGPHCAPYGVRDEYGKSTNSHGALMVFEQAYMEMTSDSAKSEDQTLAVGATGGGKTMYRPKNDLLCDAGGYWYACDKAGGCACVSGYSCDSGKWEFCQYGCDETTGKCKSGEPQTVCQPQYAAPGDVKGPFPDACGIRVSVNSLSSGERAALTADITFTGGQSANKVIECTDADAEQEITTEDTTQKTCYVKCGGFFEDNGVKKATLEVCYKYPEPEPVVEPKIGPTPVVKPTPPEPTPTPQEPTVIKATPPEPVCKPYYEILTVKNENTEKPEVKEPGDCKYTKTITVDRADNCKKVDGDLEDKSYFKVDVPSCTNLLKGITEIGKDIIGNPYDSEAERKRKSGLVCDGSITSVDWKVEGEEITIWVDAISRANSSGYYDDSCEYEVCLYNTKGEEIKCGEGMKDWQTRAEDESFTTTFSSMGWGSLSFDTLLGWDISNLNGNFEIRLFSKDDTVPETLVESETFEVCRNDFLTLCSTNETQTKLDLSGIYDVTKDVFWGLDSTEYSKLATATETESKSKTWVLSNRLYIEMDAKNCMINDETTGQGTMGYHTIVNDPEYRKLVKETYGNETFYKKYNNMSLDSDYMYCYKTDLRNASRCNEINYGWYSFTENSSFDDTSYAGILKEWNSHQAVDEISPLDMGRSAVAPAYDPHPCAIALDKDYYKGLDTITITYTNAGDSCVMSLYSQAEGKEWKSIKEWTVGGSGKETYTLKETDPLGNYSASLNCGECYVKDKAVVNVSIINNVMSRVFTVSPFLEDIRNKLTWTAVGNNTLYGGAGFERYDRCALSCNASDTKFRLLSGCTNAQGSERLECSNCTDKGNCTVDSKGKCTGQKGDCWDQICRIRTRNYALEADPGQKGDSFHGVPYDGKCPVGFPKEPIQIGYYTRPADDELWSSDANPLGQKEPKCHLDGGVIATTTFDFSPPYDDSADAEMVFIIDTSSSMSGYWKALCDSIETVRKNVAEKGINAKYTFYALSGKDKDESESVKAVCTSEEVRNNIKPLRCSDIQTAITQPIDCDSTTYPCYQESWGPASSWASKSHQWTEGARKIILPVSDEAAYCGSNLVRYLGRDETSKSALENDEASIDEAIKNANDNSASVYSLWAGADSNVQSQMTRLSDATGGKAAKFSENDIAGQLEKILTKTQAPVYVIASNATIYMNQTAPNVWVLYQNVSQNVTVKVAKPKTATNVESSDEESQMEDQTVEIYPSLLIVETANMPFNITYVNITRNGSRYNITRIYVPNESSSDWGKSFIVSSKLILNYTLLDSAETFIVDLNNSYFTQVRRDVDYVACDQKSCGGSTATGGKAATGTGENYKLVQTGSDKTASCGAISSKGEGDYKTYRRETKTELLEKEYGEVDRLETTAINHENVLCDTLTELKVEGTIDEYYDSTGNLIMSSSSDDPIKITISPDILSGFTLALNDSALIYSSMIYPVSHQVTRKESAPYSDWEWRNLDDKYGYQDARFGFPAQCKKTCPGIKCNCPANDPLKATCMDFNQMDYVERTDCACAPQECYPNPCVSNRTYHEEEGSVIANGDFETGDLSMWKKVNGDSDEAIVNFSGHSGYMLKLKGAVGQIVPNLSANPYNEICVEYALNEYSKDGSIDLTVRLDGIDQTFSVWKNSDLCSDCLGWNRKCFPVKGRISNVTIKSSVEAYIDNINTGKYYDYVSVSTYATSRYEYMDQHMRGWETMGMLKTGGVTHTGNTYRFEIESLPRIYMEARNFSIASKDAADVKNELETQATADPNAASSDSADRLSAVSKFFADNGITLSSHAWVSEYLGTGNGNGKWSIIDGDRRYDITEDSGGNINVMSIGFASISMAEQDYKNGALQIKTFFNDIYLPLSPNVARDKSAAEPVCYTMDLKFRRPSKLSVSVSPGGYTVQLGTKSTVYYKLTYWDGTPIPNGKVYVGMSGADIWGLSPEGVNKDYVFSFQEIKTKTEQQNNFRKLLTTLGYADEANDLKDATYTQSGDKVTIAATAGTASLEDVKGVCHLKLANGEDIIMGITETYEGKLLVYESEAQKASGYVITDADGLAQYSLKTTGSSPDGTAAGGADYSVSSASTGMHTVSLKSPLLSKEFLLLALILIFGVFSYRYFGNRKIDLFSWWRDFRGKK